MWGLIIAGVAAVAQIASGSKARKDAEEIANRNALGIRAETTEKIRKTLLSQQQQFGSARSNYGASGFSLESETVDFYLKQMQSNFDKDIDWLKRARELGVKTELQKGSTASSQIQANTLANVLSTVSSAYNSSQKG